jgi:hypothetical protein
VTFNSRVGNKNDFIVHDKVNKNIDDIDYNYEPDSTSCRATIDSKHNNYGIKLLDLCKSSCLRIIDGRIGNTNTYTFYLITVYLW